jgi:hypothetical protein
VYRNLKSFFCLKGEVGSVWPARRSAALAADNRPCMISTPAIHGGRLLQRSLQSAPIEVKSTL